jgi:hypothetical protein
MIFKNKPTDWKDLELRVGQILSECGCRVERGKHLRLPRGEVDVDIYARDLTREPNLVIVCECKHWKTKVPQSTVHSFRTVMNEVGAHVGFIISSRGFQRGAIESVRNTNIELVTWEQFQERFYERWFDAMQSKLDAVAAKVFDYSDYFHRRTSNVLHAIPERVDELQGMWKQFSAYGEAHFASFMKQRISFPHSIIDPRPGAVSGARLEAPDARTYFDVMMASAQPAIDAYEAFIAKYEKADTEKRGRTGQ